MQILEKNRTNVFSLSPQPPPKNDLKIVFLSLLGFLLAILVGVIAYNDQGEPEILPDRKQQLDTALRKLDNAEQYALLARTNGMYLCPSCKGKDSIFLFAGEVWKYGVSTNGSKRYSNKFLQTNNLRYFMQYLGNVGECLKQEKIRIFYYPTLPENIKREIKLLRPPGNLEDY